MDEYIVGGVELGFTNNKDLDILRVIDSNEVKIIRGHDDKKDIFTWTTALYNKVTTFSLSTDDELQLYKYLYLVLYQIDYRLIDKKFPYKFDILEHKDKILCLIGEAFNSGAEGATKKLTTEDKCCLKSLYHIAWNLFSIEEGTTDLNQEHRKICEKIHDQKMPISYVDDLYGLYSKLLK